MDQYEHELNVRNNIDYVDFFLEKEQLSEEQAENLKQMLKGEMEDYELAVSIIDYYLALHIKERIKEL